MKKRVMALGIAFFLTLSMAACGAGGGDKSASPAMETADSASEYEMPMENTADYGMNTASDDAGTSAIYDDSKLILRGSIDAEATDFPAAVAAIEQQVAKAGGYIESSSSSGNVGYRYASFTIRVPREAFETLFNAVGENCHVLSSSRSSENVSADYYDSEARKAALETKRERLLALLEKADKMEDIIDLENALSDVQYEIECLSGTLRNYDRLISFSTIELYLSEVRDLSLVQEEDSFMSELKTAAISGTRGLISFVQGIILMVVYGWWFFVIVAAAAVIAVRVIRRKRREKAEFERQMQEPLAKKTDKKE